MYRCLFSSIVSHTLSTVQFRLVPCTAWRTSATTCLLGEERMESNYGNGTNSLETQRCLCGKGRHTFCVTSLPQGKFFSRNRISPMRPAWWQNGCENFLSRRKLPTNIWHIINFGIVRSFALILCWKICSWISPPYYSHSVQAPSGKISIQNISYLF